MFPEEFAEKETFEGLSFLYQGKMTVGVVKEALTARVLSEKIKAVLTHDSVRQMDLTKRPMKEFVFVSQDGFKTEEQLLYWTN